MPIANGTHVLGTPRLRVVAPPVTRTLRRATDPGFLPGLAGGLGHETLPGMGDDDGLGLNFGNVAKGVSQAAVGIANAAKGALQKVRKVAIKPGRYFTRPNAGAAAAAGPVKGMSPRFAIGSGVSGLGAMGSPLSRLGKVARAPGSHPIPGVGRHVVPEPSYHLVQMPTLPDPWVFAGLSGRGMLRSGGVMARYNNPRGILGLGHMREPNAAGMFGLGSDAGARFALANQNAKSMHRGGSFRNRPISPKRLGRDQPIPGAPNGGFLPGLFCDDAEGVEPAAIGYMSQSELMADMMPTPAGPVAPAEDTTGRTLLIAGGVMFALGYLLRRAHHRRKAA